MAELHEGRGRPPIYNDANQVYQADPAGLFDHDFRRHGVLSIDERDTSRRDNSVMRIDCQPMSSPWPLSDARHRDRERYEADAGAQPIVLRTRSGVAMIPSWVPAILSASSCRSVLAVDTSGAVTIPGMEMLHADPRNLDRDGGQLPAADAVYCGNLTVVADEQVPWLLDALLSSAAKVFCARWTDAGSRDERWWEHALSVATSRNPNVSWQFELQRSDGTVRLRRGGPKPDGTPPHVWVLTDDKAGHSTQSFGLADALGWPCERKDLHFNRKARRSTRRLGASIESVDLERSSALQPPWPDLVIATGKRAAPAARWIAEQSKGLTRLVQLGRKGGNVAEQFDLTVTCTHFRQPRHPNREEILAPITAVNPARLREAHERWSNLFADRPRPWVALLVGGRSASHDIDAATARRMGSEVAAAVKAAGGSLYVVTSPRTGSDATAALCDALREAFGDASLVYAWKRGDPDNPYLGSLAVSDALVVTGDSESMIAEAMAAGKPTYIFDTPVRSDHAFKPRNVIRSWVQSHANPPSSESAGNAAHRAAHDAGALERFCARLIERGLVQPLRDLGAMHAGLYAAGLARPFASPIETGWQRAWTETDRIAARVAAMLGVPPNHSAGGDA